MVLILRKGGPLSRTCWLEFRPEIPLPRIIMGLWRLTKSWKHITRYNRTWRSTCSCISFVTDQIQSAILTFVNNVASLAIEQCLLSDVAKILSSATVRDMEDDEPRAIAAELNETMQERARLSNRIKTLEKGLGILRFYSGKYGRDPFSSSPITVARG